MAPVAALDVPRIDCENSSTVQLLSECRVPAILTRTVTTTAWPAATRWTDPDYITQHLPVLHDAYVAEASEECSSRLLAPDPSGEVVATLSTSRFFEADESAPIYFARWFGYNALEHLRADAMPMRPLLIADDVGDHDEERRYFRLGSVGSVSSLHYDSYQNLFAQVSGQKQWWLLPPTSWQVAMGFPRGHERARQSPRSPVREWSAEEASAAGVIHVRTVPGEVLYVPPYWLHQTNTTHTSVAVNVWSPSREAQHAATALSLTSELHGALLGSASKAAAMCVAARAVRAAAAALAPDEPGGLLEAIHAAQHAHVSRRGGPRRASASSNVDAPAPPAAAAAALADDACGGPCEAPSATEAASAERIADAIRTRLPAGVAQLTLADLLAELAEHVASAVPPTWRGAKGKARAVRCLIALGG